MTTHRARQLKASNNPDDPRQNICARQVAVALGVAHLVRYLHTIEDLVRALRRFYTVRSRKSAARVKPTTTVGQLRSRVAALDARYYVVRVPGHVVLLGADGRTLIDTAPRQRDRRLVTHVYGVYVNERSPIW